MDMTHTDPSSLQSRRRGAAAGCKGDDRLHARAHRSADLHGRYRRGHRHARTYIAEALLGIPWACTAQILPRLRLAAAREALLATSNGSVTDIAARFGFAHFGRFSGITGAASENCHPRLAAGSNLATSGSRGTVSAPSLSATMPSLVILPFRTPGDRESNWFAEGLAELLAAELARGPALRVRLAPAAQAAAMPRLGAPYCLSGRVVHATGRMRVILRLIDVAEDRHLWGDSFDGDVRDALTLQDLVVRGALR